VACHKRRHGGRAAENRYTRAAAVVAAAAAVADLAGHSLVPDAECIRKSSRKAVSPVRVMAKAPL
jgi:hypothetical protein